MIIIELLKYFAKMPEREGVLDVFANGRSTEDGYRELQRFVHLLSSPLVPGIQHFVFGQSLEAVKQRVNKVSGTYLFVDFGEFESSRDQRNSITDKQRLAVTVAKKMKNSADIIEEVLASDRCLHLLNDVRACMLADSQKHSWLKMMSDTHSIIPFESKDLNSIGWTLMFDAEASDWFDVKSRTSSFLNYR